MVENEPVSGDVAPPAVRWRLCLLGEFRLTDEAGTEAAGLGRLDRALLAYLALNQEQRHPRAKVALLLWPNRIEALRSLSVSLNALRRALGDSDRGYLIALKNDPILCRFQTIEVDALTFAHLVAQGTPDALAQAESLYRGDLLDGMEVKSDEFNDWLAAERVRLRGLAVEGLCRLMQHRQQRGLSQKALETARHILQIDELCQDAHRAIIRLHLDANQRAAARGHAQFCEQLLQRRGVELEPHTERLVAECRQGVTTVSNHSDSPPELPSESTAGPAEPGSLHLPPIILNPPPALPSESSSQPPKPRPSQLHPVIPRSPPALPADSSPKPTATRAPHDVTPSRPVRRRWFRIGIPVLGFRITISFVMTVALLFVVSSTAIVADNWTVPELARAPLGRYVAWIKEQIWGIAQRQPPSIAVLPFEAVGDDPIVAEVAEGISYELTNALAIVSEMFVVAPYAVLPYEDRQDPVGQVARMLGVRYVLEGSVQKSGNRVRIRVNLTDTQQGVQSLWSETYDRETIGIFALQDEITLEIMTNVQASATEGEKERITKSHGTNNLQAWLKTGRALKLLRHVREDDNAAARDLYLQATQLDPDYPGAWDGLAWTHLLAARFGWSRAPEADIQKAVQFAETALRLDPSRGRTHSLLGTIRLLIGDFDEAERLGETAVELEPNDADAAALLAYSLTYLDEPNRAIQLIERAMRLSPYYPDWYGWVLARASRLAGDQESALAALAAVTSKNAIAPLAESILIHVESGHLAEANLAAQELLRLQPNFSVRRFMQVPPYKDTDTRNREIDQLLRAGLPD
jgi:TolB-like protein/DNA-binding SARP family transcriptional activator